MTVEQYAKKGDNILKRIFKDKCALESFYSVNDCRIETETEYILGEIKTRECFIHTFPDHLLEIKKLKALFKKAKNNAKQKKQKIYYINYFKGNMVVIYDLNKVLDIIKSKDIKGKLRFVSSKFKKRTASNLKDFGKKVDKDIIMLNPSIAKKIFYLDDDIKPVVC